MPILINKRIDYVNNSVDYIQQKKQFNKIIEILLSKLRTSIVLTKRLLSNFFCWTQSLIYQKNLAY